MPRDTRVGSERGRYRFSRFALWCGSEKRMCVLVAVDGFGGSKSAPLLGCVVRERVGVSQEWRGGGVLASKRNANGTKSERDCSGFLFVGTPVSPLSALCTVSLARPQQTPCPLVLLLSVPPTLCAPVPSSPLPLSHSLPSLSPSFLSFRRGGTGGMRGCVGGVPCWRARGRVRRR